MKSLLMTQASLFRWHVALIVFAWIGINPVARTIATEPKAVEPEVVEPKTDETTVELSVPPAEHVTYPPDRPRWIDETRNLEASDQEGETIRLVGVSGPSPSPEIAAEMMQVMARGAIENHIQRLADRSGRSIPVDAISVDADWVSGELIARRYDGVVQTGDLQSFESACLIELDADAQDKLGDMIASHEVYHR